MRVRCGRCQTEFDVPGAGRYACPVCQAENEVRVADGPTGAPTAAPAHEATVAPVAPPQKVQCHACEFEFVVGDVEVAPCPNCRTDVVVDHRELEDSSG